MFFPHHQAENIFTVSPYSYVKFRCTFSYLFSIIAIHNSLSSIAMFFLFVNNKGKGVFPSLRSGEIFTATSDSCVKFRYTFPCSFCISTIFFFLFVNDVATGIIKRGKYLLLFLTHMQNPGMFFSLVFF